MMVRYCGHCGNSLSVEAVASGRCPVCGAEVDASTSEVSPDLGLHLDATTHFAFGASGTPTQPYQPPATPARSAKQRGRPLWIISLVVAVALLCACASVLALAHFAGGTGGQDGTVLGSATNTALAASSGATPSPSISSTFGGGAPLSTPISLPGQATTSPSAIVSATSTDVTPIGSPAPSPASSPTATPAPPYLVVTPTMPKPIAVCYGSKISFTVSNSGGAALIWNASANVTKYAISPKIGTIDPGLQVTVTVSNIDQSGIVTVSGYKASNSPQQVTITCTL